MDVKIGKVETEIVVTEGVGPLAPEEVGKLVSLVLEQLRDEQDRLTQRQSDTAIGDSLFQAPR